MRSKIKCPINTCQSDDIIENDSNFEESWNYFFISKTCTCNKCGTEFSFLYEVDKSDASIKKVKVNKIGDKVTGLFFNEEYNKQELQKLKEWNECVSETK